jgi:hypothetical protein
MRIQDDPPHKIISLVPGTSTEREREREERESERKNGVKVWKGVEGVDRREEGSE